MRGRRLELVSLDDWSDRTTGQQRADELLIDPLVVAAAVWRSSSALPALTERGLAALPLDGGADAPGVAERLLDAIEAALPDGAGPPSRPAVARRIGQP